MPSDKRDTQAIEILGRNYLVSQLVGDGLEVARPERDRGVDLIAYIDLEESAGGFVACPIQMKAASTALFCVFRKYERISHLLLTYVWHVGDPTETTAFALSYSEAKSVADELGWTRTESWKKAGYTTTRPGKTVRALLEPFEMGPGDWKRKVRELGSDREADLKAHH